MPHPADDIIASMQSPTAEDRVLIQKAYDVAKEAHGEEKRKSGEPYITHPHAIALRLAKLSMDRDTIVAGILHDTVEDTTLTLDDIKKDFGATVTFLVESVTKLSNIKYRGLDRNIESLRRLLVATASDIRVIVIKLADRLHNMETIEFVAPEKQKRIAKETMEVYVPIAGRLGMGAIRKRLEDLAFKVLEPKKYAETFRTLKEKRAEQEKTLLEILKDMKRDLAEGGMRNFKTETRIKGIHSFAIKLENKDGHIDKVYDLFAIRIIVPTVEDCYKALGIVHAHHTAVPGRIKDYIATPKPNGYRSLHTVIMTGHGLAVEIQIRTEEMHAESQYGVVSHFGYKTNESASSKMTYMQWLIPRLMRTKKVETGVAAPIPKWLTDLAKAVGDHPSKSLDEALKEDFFAERMFAFTPKGDVVDLPVGATPVDFAYSIHSDIGDAMVGAKVNGKMMSIESSLHNGDKVEIITKKSGSPNKKWLEFAKTTSAKKHIRAALLKKPHPR
ncbi:MAG: RelA/SpoT family protein [Patescibacteria group bacterium]